MTQENPVWLNDSHKKHLGELFGHFIHVNYLKTTQQARAQKPEVLAMDSIEGVVCIVTNAVF